MAEVLGIDVSHWQGDINWAKVKAAGVKFAMIKATDGATAVDRKFDRNWAGAKAVGIKRGAYHFHQPTDDPHRQVDNLIQNLQLDPGEIPPALDIEFTLPERHPGKPLPAAIRIPAAETWLAEVERQLNIRPMIYTGPNAWQVLMVVAGVAPAWTSKYKLWIANYQVLKPFIPVGFKAPHTIWQHTDSGHTDGIDGNVDQDKFNGSQADMDTWLATAMAKAPTPVESDTDNIPDITNQQMINAFRTAFGTPYWDIVTGAGLTGMAASEAKRKELYAGPAIADIPTLTPAQIAMLTAVVDAL